MDTTRPDSDYVFYASKLSVVGRAKAAQFFATHMKRPYNIDACICEALNRATECLQRHYELSQFETISGTPEILQFNSEDFIYEQL